MKMSLLQNLVLICLIINSSSKIINIEIIWIDPKVNNNENQYYQKIFRNFDYVNKLSCFENVSKGINYIKSLKFSQTLIIISGRAYPEFIKLFIKNINELMICPRMIIFTKEKDKFLNIYNSNKELLINHPFFNAGSVQDTFNSVLDFLKYKKAYKFKSNGSKTESFIQEFNFEYVQAKEQLILPIYLSNYIGEPEEKEIQKFNIYILDEYSYVEEIISLFEQLVYIEKIPHEILSKFWIRAYTVESDFYRTMNKDLRKANTNKYITYIQMMYEAIKIKSFPVNRSKYLYRGTYFSFDEIQTLKNYLYYKIGNLPAALVYSRSFFSFSLNKKNALNFLSKSINGMKSVLLIIDNNNDNSISHSSSASIYQFSVFKDEEEILFFPFSCFEVKNIDESNKNYITINLHYLGKYEKLFSGKEPKELIYLIPEYSNLAHDVFNSRVIKREYITYIPSWGKTYYQSNFQSFFSYTKKKTVQMTEATYNIAKNVATTSYEVAKTVVSLPFKAVSSLVNAIKDVNVNANVNYNYL